MPLRASGESGGVEAVARRTVERRLPRYSGSRMLSGATDADYYPALPGLRLLLLGDLAAAGRPHGGYRLTLVRPVRRPAMVRGLTRRYGADGEGSCPGAGPTPMGLSGVVPGESVEAEPESPDSCFGGGGGLEAGGGVGCTLPDAAPPPLGDGLGAGLGAPDATVGSSANLRSLLCHTCLVARPNSPRITTRPMPTIATSIAYSDSACPRRFSVERLRLVTTTVLRTRVTCGKDRRAEGLAMKLHSACPASGIPDLKRLLHYGQAVMNGSVAERAGEPDRGCAAFCSPVLASLAQAWPVRQPI